VETLDAEGKPPVVQLTIGGTIGQGRSTRYALWPRERTATAVYALRAALRDHGVAVRGDMKVQELEDFTAALGAQGALPVELARHESSRLADIVARINKWSINWLADRVIMTAAALTRQQPPSMELALDAMYGWLARHPHLAPSSIVLDTGSGLSYKTQITPAAIVAVIRSAAGFAEGEIDPQLAKAWLDSLAIARRDGTLRGRMRNTSAQVRGKTGTLSTVIATSGVLEVDAARPLAFSLVTNTDTPLSKQKVREAHDKIMRILSDYLAKTGRSAELPPPPPTQVEVAPPEAHDFE
jgi:PBP4 family serine-type D-alanyl-D-alanine carboxypeptidase